MFNVGAPEILVILVVALVVLGPNRLPEAGRQLGKALAEFRKVRANVQQDLREVLDVDDLRQAFDVRTMLDDRPAGRTSAGTAVAGAAGMAGAAVLGATSASVLAGGDLHAPDGAPSVPESALVATPTMAVPSPPDAAGRDILADDSLLAEVLAAPAPQGPHGDVVVAPEPDGPSASLPPAPVPSADA